MIKHINPELVPKRKLYTGEEMPGIGIGTFGSDKYTPKQVSEAVYGAIKAGYRLVDCAAVYQNEDSIGEVLHRLVEDKVVERKELFVISKVWNDMHGKGEVIKSCEKSLKDLRLDYLDLYLVHWPFPNAHAPGCDGDARNPDARPFCPEKFMDTWRQCEELVDRGMVRYIGMSNMTIRKLEQVLPLCRIRPVALEMECHPAFQQQDLFEYAIANDMQPIGYCPIGSPSRPERDKTSGDVADTELTEIVSAAKKHGIHPALVCLKWAVQRGQIPIPFSVKEEQYFGNLECTITDPLSEEEMEKISHADQNCRLVKGQVFLWEGAKSWKDLWDMEGV